MSRSQLSDKTRAAYLGLPEARSGGANSRDTSHIQGKALWALLPWNTAFASLIVATKP
jgi:hypothetical protein